LRNRQIGHTIALAAILVQAPRLVLTLLAADRQAVATSWQRVLLVVAGIGTAVVLTGGNLYLAHTLAMATRWRGQLACVWIVVLLSSGILVVPLIAGGLAGRPLHEVLGSERSRWAWAVLAAVAHEVTAAGCMLAAASPEIAGATSIGVRLGQPDLSGKQPLLLRQDSAGSARSAAGLLRQQLPQRLACREGCGRTFSSELAEIGHLRHCPARHERLKRAAAAEGPTPLPLETPRP
jgi:MFS family permease